MGGGPEQVEHGGGMAGHRGVVAGDDEVAAGTDGAEVDPVRDALALQPPDQIGRLGHLGHRRGRGVDG